MTTRAQKISLMLFSPVLSIGLLMGLARENRTYLRPDDPVFAEYHAKAKAAIESLPFDVGSFHGIDKPEDIPKEATTLLKPNKILNRRYNDVSVEGLGQSATLLIVQCKQSGDMLGHYPPNCYPSSGHEMTFRQERDWAIPQAGGENFTIPGIEYRFTKTRNGHVERTTVYNFLIVPGSGIARDMNGVQSAAEDYQQRYYGAAQFQLVFSTIGGSELEQTEHDQIFTTLMQPAVPVIKQLLSTPTAHKAHRGS
jgi:hypothetical protein